MTAARCGTTSGYRAHQSRAEKPCDACTTAKREYDHRNLSAPENTRRNRLHAKAQHQAKTRLVALYPDLYRALYQDEKERIFRDAGLEVFAFGEGRGRQS